jgi:hypothetical protein
MKLKLCLVMLVLGTLLGLIAGCSNAGGGDFSVQIGKEFTLPAGKTAAVSGEKLLIKLVSVQDSRCPQGVTCIQAGEAKCLMQITLEGKVSEVTFTSTNGTGAFGGAYFDQYRFLFQVLPYPVAGRTTAATDYKMIMTVGK